MLTDPAKEVWTAPHILIESRGSSNKKTLSLHSEAHFREKISLYQFGGHIIRAYNNKQS